MGRLRGIAENRNNTLRCEHLGELYVARAKHCFVRHARLPGDDGHPLGITDIAADTWPGRGLGMEYFRCMVPACVGQHPAGTIDTRRKCKFRGKVTGRINPVAADPPQSGEWGPWVWPA